MFVFVFLFFFQAEDGIRDLVRSRGLGDVYKRQVGHVVPHLFEGIGRQFLRHQPDLAARGAVVLDDLSLIHI